MIKDGKCVRSQGAGPSLTSDKSNITQRLQESYVRLAPPPLGAEDSKKIPVSHHLPTPTRPLHFYHPLRDPRVHHPAPYIQQEA